MTYKKTKVKVPKGYKKATRNAIPLGDLLSGKASVTGILSGMQGMAGLNVGNVAKGPGSHAPVLPSGKTIGTMADGKKIYLKGSMMGQMVR